jgi:hypothetical protein
MTQPIPIFVAVVVVFLAILTVVQNRRYRRRMRALAAERSGESICQFVRNLPYRQLNTTVIRHVYEAVQSEVTVPGCPVPIRTTDHCTDTLEMDPEDLDYLVADLADRCGRTLDGCERNPYYGRVHTVGDLVHFLCAQPKTQ